MNGFKTAAVVAACALAAGCSNINAPKQEQGMVAGAVAGGVLGSQMGRGKGSVVAGVLGAVAGGIIGSEVGRSMDDRDRAMAMRAQSDAFARGQPYERFAWENPNTGRRGEIVPGPVYHRGPDDCRDFTHTVFIDGRPQAMRGVACRNPDGTWRELS